MLLFWLWPALIQILTNSTSVTALYISTVIIKDLRTVCHIYYCFLIGNSLITLSFRQMYSIILDSLIKYFNVVLVQYFHHSLACKPCFTFCYKIYVIFSWQTDVSMCSCLCMSSSQVYASRCTISAHSYSLRLLVCYELASMSKYETLGWGFCDNIVSFTH